MADGAIRQLTRRLIPRRLRWLAKALFKRITGLYYRDILRQQQDTTRRLDVIQHQATVALPAQIVGRLDVIQHQTTVALPAQIADRLDAIQHQAIEVLPAQMETQGEILDLVLRRLRKLEGETVGLAKPLGLLQDEVTSWSQPMRALAGKPIAGQPSSPQAERPGIAILCRSLGRRCGIAEYAKLLAQRLGGVPVASVADAPPDTDVVFVQYEPALYPRVSDIIDEVDSISPFAIAVVDAHNIFPDVAAELRWHALVGTKRNLYPGTLRLSLCLPVLEATEDEPAQGLRLGSFGFAFPAKRYEMIIALAQRLGIGATILAAHNDATPGLSELSASYLAHLKDLAGDDIEVIDDFLPPEEVIQQLRRCSHLVSCMDDNAAQSASLRTMAASGRPLISLPTEPAREVGAILVDNLDSITLEFLEGCRQLPQPYDGIADYHSLLQGLAWAKSLAQKIHHSDSLYLDDPRQMERLTWLRQNVTGRAIDIGIGNGFSTNYIRAVAGVDIRPDRLSHASLRYPHIDFRLLNAKVHALPGFDTVVFAEIVEHMPLVEAKQMVELWAKTGPTRILLTTPNAGKPGYEDALVRNPEHVWEPTEELIASLVPTGYHAVVTTSSKGDFLLVDMGQEG